MRKLLIIIPATLLIIMIFISSNLQIIVCKDSNLEDKLKYQMGDNYYKMYDYKYCSLGYLKIVMPITTVDVYKPEFSGSESEKFEKIIDYMNRFNYTYDQPNPDLVLNLGGNCQALSIVLQEVCEANNLECELCGTKTHMYCKILVNGNYYNADLSNKTIEKVKE